MSNSKELSKYEERNRLAMPADLDNRERGAEVAKIVREIRSVFGTGSVIPDISHAEELLGRAERALHTVPVLAENLAGLSRKATSDETIRAIAVLMQSRASKRPDAEFYGRQLTLDVWSQRPTFGALESTCRRIRLTCKYHPEIAEVIGVLADEEYKLNFELQSAASLFEQEIDRLRKAIERERERKTRAIS